MMLAALALLFIAQIAVPVAMISGQERILEKGKEFRFATRPLDPTDYMRGKYVRLFFNSDPVKMETSEIPEDLYAYLSTGPDGFAKIDSLSATEPDSGDYLKVKLAYRSGKMVHYSLPFERFYMEETKAPAAEDLYLKLPDSVKAFAKVRVLEGESVIENVYVGNKPIGQLATEHLMKGS